MLDKITLICDTAPALNELKHIENLIDMGVVTEINYDKLSDCITTVICKSISIQKRS